MAQVEINLPYWKVQASDGNGDVTVTFKVTQEGTDPEVDVDALASDIRDAVEAYTGLTVYLAQKYTESAGSF